MSWQITRRLSGLTKLFLALRFGREKERKKRGSRKLEMRGWEFERLCSLCWGLSIQTNPQELSLHLGPSANNQPAGIRVLQCFCWH